MNKEVEPSFSFFGQPAAMTVFFFFFFLTASIRMDGSRGDLYGGKNCDGNLPLAHCHSLEVFIPNRFKLFLGHQRIYWKRTAVTQQVFMRFLLH